MFFYLEFSNFHPTRTCTENEIECKNSNGFKICVEEKVKDVACAKYSTIICDKKSLPVASIETDESFYNYKKLDK